MASGLAGRAATGLTALLLAACAGGAPVDATYLAERDAARAYIVSSVARTASAQAAEDIRRAGSAAERALLDTYLADPAHGRQLPARYQDYLIEMFDVDAIVVMTAWDGEPAPFARQVALHRFVLAQSLLEWHVVQAGLDHATIYDDPLTNTLAAIIRATPDPLVPQARRG